MNFIDVINALTVATCSMAIILCATGGLWVAAVLFTIALPVAVFNLVTQWKQGNGGLE